MSTSFNNAHATFDVAGGKGGVPALRAWLPTARSDKRGPPLGIRSWPVDRCSLPIRLVAGLCMTRDQPVTSRTVGGAGRGTRRSRADAIWGIMIRQSFQLQLPVRVP